VIEACDCITCGDVAVVVRVLEAHGSTALVELVGPTQAPDSGREEVAIELVEPVAIGERLLCHAGVALARVAQDAA
jgi:hydrogenase maturation factor